MKIALSYLITVKSTV